MKKLYTLIILNGADIDFKCLISEDGKYFRVQIDELDYETMINEMLNYGYTFVKHIGTDLDNHQKFIYEEKHIVFETVQEIYKALLEDDFECRLESQ